VICVLPQRLPLVAAPRRSPARAGPDGLAAAPRRLAAPLAPGAGAVGAGGAIAALGGAQRMMHLPYACWHAACPDGGVIAPVPVGWASPVPRWAVHDAPASRARAQVGTRLAARLGTRRAPARGMPPPMPPAAGLPAAGPVHAPKFHLSTSEQKCCQRTPFQPSSGHA
jgi:hypothetical protein